VDLLFLFFSFFLCVSCAFLSSQMVDNIGFFFFFFSKFLFYYYLFLKLGFE
jgi:hypothetical protein